MRELTYGAMHCGMWVPSGALVALRKCGAESLVELCDFGDWSPVEVSNVGHGLLVEQCSLMERLLLSYPTQWQSDT